MSKAECNNFTSTYLLFVLSFQLLLFVTWPENYLVLPIFASADFIFHFSCVYRLKKEIRLFRRFLFSHIWHSHPTVLPPFPPLGIWRPSVASYHPHIRWLRNSENPSLHIIKERGPVTCWHLHVLEMTDHKDRIKSWISVLLEYCH